MLQRPNIERPEGMQLRLVDPVGRRELVLGNALGEPEGDLLLAVLDRVGAVADVGAGLGSAACPGRLLRRPCGRLLTWRA
jgi:hypothetical protein